MAGNPVEDPPRLIEVGDAPADMPGKHAVVIRHSYSQATELYFSTAELHDLINKSVQRLYEIGELEWV